MYAGNLSVVPVLYNMGANTPSRLPISLPVILLALYQYNITVLDPQVSVIYMVR